MNKILLLAGCILAAPALADETSTNLNLGQMEYDQTIRGRQTSTYVRCWYRLSTIEMTRMPIGNGQR